MRTDIRPRARAVARAALALAGLTAVPLACGPGATDEPPSASDVDDVVGGAPETGHDYVVEVGDGQNPGCTGTVIGRRTVLTAAHCQDLPVTTVRFGAVAKDPANERRRVVRQVRHPAFSEDGPNGTMLNDLLVLQLDRDAPVAPAPVLREALTNDATFVGPDWTLIGYGRTTGEGNDYGTKRKVVVPIEAVGPGRAPSGQLVGETQVFHRNAGRGICNGDSGGPGFVVRGGVEVQAGVASSGDRRCSGRGFHQKVDRGVLASFLQAVIDDFEGGDACRSDGACNESCNAGGQVLDPDCAADHCAADGVCSTACVAPADPDCAGPRPDPAPPPDPAPQPAGDLFCPTGFALEAASRLCASATEALGPFPPAMVARCRELNGGDDCARATWALSFARDLRGTGPCPLGASLDPRKGYCAEGADLYGPFRRADVDACVASGGGPACTASLRWDRELVADRP
jgi:hypothetical protein